MAGIPVDPEWGRWGKEAPCQHMRDLLETLESNGLRIWSEHSDTGWVNVHCAHCRRTYQVMLRPTEGDDGVKRWTGCDG